MVGVPANPMKFQDEADAACMKRLAAGDSSALHDIMQRYRHRVLSVAYRYMRNWADAEDMTQEAFVRLWQSAERYEPQAKLMTYLYRITANVCLDARRQRARRPQQEWEDDIDRPSTLPEPEQVLEGDEAADRIARAVAALPDRQRLAVIFLRYEGLNYRQIAETMDMSVSAADSLIARAMANLRQSLADLLGKD